jgi:hypothetical protein
MDNGSTEHTTPELQYAHLRETLKQWVEKHSVPGYELDIEASSVREAKVKINGHRYTVWVGKGNVSFRIGRDQDDDREVYEYTQNPLGDNAGDMHAAYDKVSYVKGINDGETPPDEFGIWVSAESKMKAERAGNTNFLEGTTLQKNAKNKVDPFAKFDNLLSDL